MTADSINRYAVLGHPIHHSLSPQIHAAYAEQTKQNITYTALDVLASNLFATLSRLPNEGFLGVNITVPHKETAWLYATRNGQLTERASMAGAVNTLAWNKDGLVADNTDGQGLLNDLQERHHLSINNTKILVLGAGGATRGIILPLLNANPTTIVIANRTPERAVALTDVFASNAIKENCLLHGCGLEALPDLERTFGPFDIVINASSASLSGETIHLPQNLLKSNGFAYDMMYSSKLTPFLDALVHSADFRYADGLGMLVEQAAIAFAIWRGVHPNTQPVYEMLRKNLRKS